MKGMLAKWLSQGAERGRNAEHQNVGFALDDFELHGAGQAVGGRPLRISSAGDPWSYLTSWRNNLPVFRAMASGLRVEFDVRVLSGKVEVGLVAGDFATFLARCELTAGEQTVALETPSAASVAAVVLRHMDASGPVIIEVAAIRNRLQQGQNSTKERGFVVKSAVDDLVARVASRDVVVVDVGANKGDMVDRFLTGFPSAQVWALEPHPETFERLARRYRQDARVRLRQLGLSGLTGSAVMHSYTNAAINSLSPVAEGAEQLVDGGFVATRQVAVDLRSLEEFVSTEGMDRIDILKLDTQGHEFEILSGANDLLRSGKVRYILAELLFAPLYASQAKAGDVVSLLEACGFKLFDFYDFVYDEARGLKWGDALFEFAGD